MTRSQAKYIPPRLIVSTVGISLLLHLARDEPTTYGLLLRLANAQTLASNDEAVVLEVAQRVAMILAGDDIARIRQVSAELNGVYALYAGQLHNRIHDHHILVTTDTALGRRCADLVAAYLERHGFAVQIQVPQGLTTESTAAFEMGSKALIFFCANDIPPYRAAGYRVVFNLVAAFKALQGYLNTIGMFYADEILYLFEGPGAEPVLIPRLPIAIDADALKPFVVELAMMEQEGIAPQHVAELPRILYDSDNNTAILSSWGTLVWQQVRVEQLGGELLHFPRLRYQPEFEHDEKRIRDASERVRLHETLAKVAAILEQNNGDTARLKSHGGLQYDNYVNKRYNGCPLGHFRVSDGLRVSCIAENGGLTLRRCGAHDDVNRNP